MIYYQDFTFCFTGIFRLFKVQKFLFTFENFIPAVLFINSVPKNVKINDNARKNYVLNCFV